MSFVTAIIGRRRVAHAAAAIGDSIYVFGGREGVDETRAFADLWAFHTASSTWEQLSAAGSDCGAADAGVCAEHTGAPCARSYHAMCAAAGSLFVFGGCGADGRMSDLWRYDVASRKWAALPSSPLIKGRGGSCLAAAGGALYVVAGFCGHELNDTHRYDIAAGTWTQIEAASAVFSPRSVAVLVAAGPPASPSGKEGDGPGKQSGVTAPPPDRLVLFGGELETSASGHAGAGKYTAEMFEFDLSAGVPAPVEGRAWRSISAAAAAAGGQAAEWPAPRGWLAACSAPNGAVCVHGGNSESNDRLDDAFILTFY